MDAHLKGSGWHLWRGAYPAGLGAVYGTPVAHQGHWFASSGGYLVHRPGVGVPPTMMSFHATGNPFGLGALSSPSQATQQAAANLNGALAGVTGASPADCGNTTILAACGAFQNAANADGAGLTADCNYGPLTAAALNQVLTAMGAGAAAPTSGVLWTPGGPCVGDPNGKVGCGGYGGSSPAPAPTPAPTPAPVPGPPGPPGGNGSATATATTSSAVPILAGVAAALAVGAAVMYQRKKRKARRR